MARKIIWWYLYSFSLLIGAIFHLPSVIFDAFFFYRGFSLIFRRSQIHSRMVAISHQLVAISRFQQILIVFLFDHIYNDKHFNKQVYYGLHEKYSCWSQEYMYTLQLLACSSTSVRFFCAKQVSRSVNMIDKFKSTPYSFIPLQSKKVALRKMSWKSCHWVLETLGRASHVVWSSVMKTLLDSIRITKNTKKRRWKCCLSGKKNMLLKQLTRLCILPFAMSL